MSDYIIKVENLSKSYQIKHQNAERYTALRDVITNNVKHMGGRLLGRRNGHGPTQETFWALNDVSFEVKPGERVGIIGRNGAGKSTLLKILSRITEPTSGRVRLRGRVASLLEVGTGFHPELTGRENIYLNGAILGMTRDEIKRKFDEIVAFAEVERFLDTPVKRYSSGMYVRLAFAVAAHLEPEILVVDEVLAVGDAAFQKKCLGRMGEVAKEGRTIIFVSHNMAQVSRLCSRSILLNSGQLIEDNLSQETITHYYALNSQGNVQTEDNNLPYILNRRLLENLQSKPVSVLDFQIIKQGGERPETIFTGDTLILQVNYYAAKKFISPGFMISIKSFSGIEVFRLSNMPISGFSIDYIEGHGQVELQIDFLPLTAGSYYIDFAIAHENVAYIVQLPELVQFDVHENDVYGSGHALNLSRGLIVIPRHEWRHNPEPERNNLAKHSGRQIIKSQNLNV